MACRPRARPARRHLAVARARTGSGRGSPGAGVTSAVRSVAAGVPGRTYRCGALLGLERGAAGPCLRRRSRSPYLSEPHRGHYARVHLRPGVRPCFLARNRDQSTDDSDSPRDDAVDRLLLSPGPRAPCASQRGTSALGGNGFSGVSRARVHRAPGWRTLLFRLLVACGRSRPLLGRRGVRVAAGGAGAAEHGPPDRGRVPDGARGLVQATRCADRFGATAVDCANRGPARVYSVGGRVRPRRRLSERGALDRLRRPRSRAQYVRDTGGGSVETRRRWTVGVVVGASQGDSADKYSFCADGSGRGDS